MKITPIEIALIAILIVVVLLTVLQPFGGPSVRPVARADIATSFGFTTQRGTVICYMGEKQWQAAPGKLCSLEDAQ